MSQENSDSTEAADGGRLVDVIGPVVTETGAVARMATFENGSFVAQTYVSGRGWRPNIVSAYSIMIAFGGADEETLIKMGYSKEQIAEILETPETETDPT